MSDEGLPAIRMFDGTYYEFLSNFHPCRVVFDGHAYATVEHAYQAAKTLDATERAYVRSASTPAEAKKRGGKVRMRPDWDDIKVDVMRGLLQQKFSDPQLWNRLVETRPAALIEGNTWGDRFWGVCDGEGQNWLGRLLMEIRDRRD